MTKENWIKWLQARIPVLKEGHNEFWLGQALDGYKNDELAKIIKENPPLEINPEETNTND